VLQQRRGILLIRILMGSLFVYHGFYQLLVTTPDSSAAFFEKIGYPAFLAYPVIFAEICGGFLLLIGFLTRWNALMLAIIMFFAIPAHWKQGFHFVQGGIEVPFTFMIILIGIALDAKEYEG